MKNVILITAFQLAGGFAFSQKPDPLPEPPAPEPKTEQVKPETYQVVEEPAEFPGGKAKMYEFLAANMKYPERAVEAGLEGKCYLQFVVRKSGEITDIKVKKGVADCPECDKEAIRVVKLMPKWKPGKNNGKAVDSYYTMPLTFKMN